MLSSVQVVSMANPEVQRVTRLNVRLSDEMSGRLDRLAETMGIPASTLAAVAVAEYVNNKTAQRDLMHLVAEKQAERAGEMLEKLFADPATLAAMASAVEAGERTAQARLEGV